MPKVAASYVDWRPSKVSCLELGYVDDARAFTRTQEPIRAPLWTLTIYLPDSQGYQGCEYFREVADLERRANAIYEAFVNRTRRTALRVIEAKR